MAACHLPLLAGTARALIALDPESGGPMDRVCGTFAGDPGAVLELLRRANGYRQGHLGSPVGTIESAAMMLGVEQMRTLPETLPGLDVLRADDIERGYLQLASRAYHAGIQAYRWALRRGDLVPKEAFLAAMLHDVGELMLSLHGGARQLHKIRVLQQTERMPADEAQYVVLGFSLEQLSHALALRWRLPELVTHSLEADHAQQPRVLGVMLAAQLARLAEFGWYGEELDECLDNAAAWLEMPVAALTAEVHGNAVEAARDLVHFGVWPAARRLPMLPGDELPEDGGSGDGAPEAGAPVHFCLMPQPAAYDEVVAQLQDFVPGELNFHDLMPAVMRGLHDGLGLNRVVFAILNRDRSALQARYLAGTDNDPGFSRFRVELHTPHLFSKLLEREQALWLNEGNRAKLWSLVPEALRRLIHTDTFFAASVVVEGKPIGVFYADRHLPDSRLDENAYRRFKHLCRLSSAAIAKLRSA